MHCFVRTSVLVAGLLACALTARAQDSAAAFGQLPSAVKPGDDVIVTDAEGRDVRGRITALSPASLAIDVDGTTREWSAGDVRLIRHRQPDSLVNGTLIGLGVGAGVGFGLAIGVAMAEVYGGDGSGESAAANMVLALGTAAGAAIGLGIDAARRDEVVVYRAAGAPASGASVRLMPLVTRHAQGLRVAVVF